MEPHPRVFVSTASTDDWKSDPEVPGSEIHQLVYADGVQAGLTRFTSVDGPVPWTPRADGSRRGVVEHLGANGSRDAGSDPTAISSC